MFVGKLTLSQKSCFSHKNDMYLAFDELILAMICRYNDAWRGAFPFLRPPNNCYWLHGYQEIAAKDCHVEISLILILILKRNVPVIKENL